MARLNQKHDKTALSQCVPSRFLWYQGVRQKSALNIAAFRVSDWLRSATAWGLWMGPLVSFFNISCQFKQQWLFKIVVNAQSKIWMNYNIPDLYRKKTMFMPWQLTARGVDCMFIFGNVDQNMIQQRCSCLLLSVCQFSACEFQHC